MQPERYQRRIERPGFGSAFGPETAQITQLRSEREHLYALLVREKRQVTRKGFVPTREEHEH